MAKDKSRKTGARTPTAAELLAELHSAGSGEGGGGGTVGGIAVMFDPEDGDAPVGMLTDAQLGNRIRLICARGYGAFVFPSGGQLYLRVIRPE